MKKIFFIIALTGGVLQSPAQGRFEITSGANIRTNGNAFIVLNNLNVQNNGSFVQAVGDGTTRLTGDINTVTSGTGTTTLDQLEVAVNSGVTHALSSLLSIRNVLTLSSGQLISNGSLTLKSSVANTARVAPVASTFNPAVAGNVTVERYIPDDGHRAWRLLSVPTTGTQTILQAWQDTAKNYPGYGTLITSPLYDGSNGFDTYSNNPSMLIHDQTVPSWTTIPLTNTNNTRLDSRPGYMLFVRGSRNALPSNSLHDATTLRSTGNLRQGPVPVTVSANGTGYTLVGNPYASPIDFESIAGTTNLQPYFQIWDANLGGIFGVGGYRLVERTAANTYVATPSSGSAANDNTLRYFHLGQAFFLKAAGSNASVLINESSKTSATSAVNPFREQGAEAQLTADLMTMDAGNLPVLTDGIRVRFGKTYSPDVTGDDILKIPNFSENLAVRRNNNLLIVERRPEAAADDTIFLHLSNTGTKNYAFRIECKNMPSATTAYLLDKYLATQTYVDLNALTEISFSINADAASAAPDRFKIVFKTGGALPVMLQSVKAYQVSSGITVDWRVENESGIKNYVVEKSLDGRTFASAALQPATGNNTSAINYTWLDQNAREGDNYYRIKSNSLAGQTSYSQVLKVTIGKGRPRFLIYPNPIADRMINLQFINQTTGTYYLKLANMAGQVMDTRKIVHVQGSGAEVIQLPSSIAHGKYTLEITAPDNSTQSLSIIN